MRSIGSVPYSAEPLARAPAEDAKTPVQALITAATA